MIKDIYPNEAFEMIETNSDNSNFVLLDVRTPMEFMQNKIDGSILIDISSYDFLEKVKELNKEKSYLIYCRTGARSSAALDLFRKLGFSDAYNLVGGIMYWQEEGYPVIG